MVDGAVMGRAEHRARGCCLCRQGEQPRGAVRDGGCRTSTSFGVFKARCDAFLKHTDRIDSVSLFAVIYQQLYVKKHLDLCKTEITQRWIRAGTFLVLALYKKGFSSAEWPVLMSESLRPNGFKSVLFPGNNLTGAFKVKEVAFHSSKHVVA